MQCQVCSASNDDGAKFCASCGTPLDLRCPSCAAPYRAGARFCDQCGTGLVPDAVPGVVPGGGTAPAPAAGGTAVAEAEDLTKYIPEVLLRKIRAARDGQAMRGERRTVTMLFADVQGSTAAAERLDPEEWAEIINGAFERLIAPVYHYEGTLARLQGDAILAFFGAPIAHEDDPVRAVRAALDIQAAIVEHAEQVEREHGVGLAVRVGINTGLVVVGEVGSDMRVEYTALGDAINVAARMEQTAAPGTVQVTGDTLALLGDTFVTESIGPVEVKGKREPVPAHRVLGLTGARRQDWAVDRPLVGRDEDLARLASLVDRLADGFGGIATLVGEAGIGKSSLLAAMRARVGEHHTLATSWDAQGDVAWLRGRSRSYERSMPHSTFADLLGGWWCGADGEVAFEAVAAAVEAALGEPDQDTAGFLAALVGAPLPVEQQALLDGLFVPVRHARTTDALQRYLLAECARRPLGVVLDDLHWCDAVSLALIEELMTLAETAAFGLLLVMRPNRDDPAWRLVEVAARDHAHRHTALELGALPEQATTALLTSLLDGADVDPELRAHILERSGGNPLFVEEIVHAIGEPGTGGASASTTEVPRSLSSLLTARLDRLDDRTRHVATVASVIGREFDTDTLAALVDDPTELTTQLVELTRRGLLELRRPQPSPTYSFRHPLLRETAYSTVLRRTRRELHGRIAAHLHATDPGASQEIAHHYVEAGDTDAAFPHLVAAGRLAVRAMALSDAIAHTTRALEAPPVDADPALVREAHELLGEAYELLPDLTRSSAAYQELRAFGRSAGDRTVEVKALNRLAYNAAALAGDLDGAERYLGEARTIAEDVGDEAGLAEYHMNACLIRTMSGDIDGAVDHDAATAYHGLQAGDIGIRITGLLRKSLNLGMILRFEESLAAADEALELASGVESEEVVAVLQAQGRGSALLQTGDLTGALELLRTWGPVVDRHSSYYGASMHFIASKAHQLHGEPEGALAAAAAMERYADLLGQEYARACGFSVRARTLSSAGIFDETDDLQAAAVASMDTPAGDFLSTSVWVNLAAARLHEGDLERARAALDEAARGRSVTTLVERPSLGSLRARLELLVGDLAAARAALEDVREAIATYGLGVYEPELLLLDGMVTVGEGRDEDAAVLLDAAVRAAGEVGCRMLRVEAQGQLAAVRSRQGETSEAEALRERARTTVREVAGAIVDETLRRAFVEARTAALVGVT